MQLIVAHLGLACYSVNILVTQDMSVMIDAGNRLHLAVLLSA